MWLDSYFPGAWLDDLNSKATQQAILPILIACSTLYLISIVFFLIKVRKKVHGCLIALLGWGMLSACGLAAWGGFYVTLFIDKTLQFSSSVPPTAGWAALGSLLGCSVGLLRAGGLYKVRSLHFWAIGVPAVCLGLTVWFNDPVSKLLQENEIRVREVAQRNEAQIRELTSILTKASWLGTVGNSPANLQVRQESNHLSGTVTYGEIAEELAVEVHPDYTVLMKGVSYRQIPTARGQNLGFALDTFSGRLSADAKTLSGAYQDAQNRRGNWTFSFREKKTI